MLTLDQFGISEQDWNQTPASVRAGLMFLIQQNQRLDNRCATYQLQVQRLEAEMERLKNLELEVAELRERLGQNSQNSSKPPSSDPPSVSRPNNRQPIGDAEHFCNLLISAKLLIDCINDHSQGHEWRSSTSCLLSGERITSRRSAQRTRPRPAFAPLISELINAK